MGYQEGEDHVDDVGRVVREGSAIVVRME